MDVNADVGDRYATLECDMKCKGDDGTSKEAADMMTNRSGPDALSFELAY